MTPHPPNPPYRKKTSTLSLPTNFTQTDSPFIIPFHPVLWPIWPRRNSRGWKTLNASANISALPGLKMGLVERESTAVLTPTISTKKVGKKPSCNLAELNECLMESRLSRVGAWCHRDMHVGSTCSGRRQWVVSWEGPEGLLLKSLNITHPYPCPPHKLPLPEKVFDTTDRHLLTWFAEDYWFLCFRNEINHLSDCEVLSWPETTRYRVDLIILFGLRCQQYRKV